MKGYNMLKRLSAFIAGMTVFTGNLMAGASGTADFDLTGRLGDVQEQLKGSEGVMQEIITIVLYIFGIIAIAWGVYEIFFDEDRQQQGKKTKGAMKIAGGILWVGIVSFVNWLTSGA